jgi:hypothetical protein
VCDTTFAGIPHRSQMLGSAGRCACRAQKYDRFRRSRSAIRRRPRMDDASWPVRHQSAGCHPLRAYRAIVGLAPVVAISLFQSCRFDPRARARRPKALRARLLCGPPLKAAPIGLGQSTTFTVSRSRASPRRKLPGIRHTIIRYRAQSQADHNSFTAIALCVCHEQSETLQKLAPKGKDLQTAATWRSRRDSAIADKVMRNDRGPES